MILSVRRQVDIRGSKDEVFIYSFSRVIKLSELFRVQFSLSGIKYAYFSLESTLNRVKYLFCHIDEKVVCFPALQRMKYLLTFFP